jgi:hypothetical protein
MKKMFCNVFFRCLNITAASYTPSLCACWVMARTQKIRSGTLLKHICIRIHYALKNTLGGWLGTILYNHCLMIDPAVYCLFRPQRMHRVCFYRFPYLITNGNKCNGKQSKQAYCKYHRAYSGAVRKTF